MFKELKKEMLDSVIVNDDHTSLVLRVKAGYLYFYEGYIKSVSGMFVFDAKYGNNDGLSMKRLKDNGNCLQIPHKEGFLVILHEGLTYQGKVLESVLQNAQTFNQITEDF
jgi:hypothetical protein